jgi:hypothetical protein
MPVPYSEAELEAFWTGAPGYPSRDAIATIPTALKRPLQTLKLSAMKFKIAFNRVSISVFFLGVCGFAIQFCAHLRERSTSTDSRSSTDSLRQWVGTMGFFIAFCCCTLAICAFSHPLTKLGVIAATLTIVICRVSPRGVFLGSRASHDVVPASLSIVCVGLFLMTFISFGLPRFTRPFLPPLYLSASLCIPLAVQLWNRQGAAVSAHLPTNNTAAQAA